MFCAGGSKSLRGYRTLSICSESLVVGFFGLHLCCVNIRLTMTCKAKLRSSRHAFYRKLYIASFLPLCADKSMCMCAATTFPPSYNTAERLNSATALQTFTQTYGHDASHARQWAYITPLRLQQRTAKQQCNAAHNHTNTCISMSAAIRTLPRPTPSATKRLQHMPTAPVSALESHAQRNTRRSSLLTVL